jgi:hypothetical protein
LRSFDREGQAEWDMGLPHSEGLPMTHGERVLRGDIASEISPALFDEPVGATVARLSKLGRLHPR